RDRPRPRGKRFRVLNHLLPGQRSGIARKQDPVGLREGTLEEKRIDTQSMKSELAANPREYRPEIEGLVADVDRDHRCRPAKMSLIDGKGLAREEMHGDCVARK